MSGQFDSEEIDIIEGMIGDCCEVINDGIDIFVGNRYELSYTIEILQNIKNKFEEIDETKRLAKSKLLKERQELTRQKKILERRKLIEEIKSATTEKDIQEKLDRLEKII